MAKRSRPRRPLDMKRIVSMSMLLVGLVFILEAIGTMVLVSSVGSTVQQLGSALPAYFIFVWTYAVIKLATGIVAFGGGLALWFEKRAR